MEQKLGVGHEPCPTGKEAREEGVVLRKLRPRCSWGIEKNVWALTQVFVDIAGMLAMPIRLENV